MSEDPKKWDPKPGYTVQHQLMLGVRMLVIRRLEPTGSGDELVCRFVEGNTFRTEIFHSWELRPWPTPYPDA